MNIDFIGKPKSVFDQISPRVKKMRRLKDQVAKYLIGAGGMIVIAAIALIFLYLLSQVIPLFKSASLEKEKTFKANAVEIAQSAVNPAQLLAIDELGESMLVMGHKGYRFQPLRSAPGKLEKKEPTDKEIGETINFPPETLTRNDFSLTPSSHQFNHFARIEGVELSLQKVQFSIQYPKAGGRIVVPSLESSTEQKLSLSDFLEVSQELDATLSSGSGSEVESADLGRLGHISTAAFHQTESMVGFAALVKSENGTASLVYKSWTKEEGLFNDDASFEPNDALYLPLPTRLVKKVLLGPDLRWLFVVEEGGYVEIFDIATGQPKVFQSLDLGGVEVTQATFLLGGTSLLLGDSAGNVSQWMPIRDDARRSVQFTEIRRFKLSDGPVVSITTEARRKGFAALSLPSGVVPAGDSIEQSLIGRHDFQLSLVNTTAQRVAVSETLAIEGFQKLALSPRGDKLVIVSSAGVESYKIDNPHPEVSWKSLWQKVWYEGYSEPKYLWQSSAANNDFEPKLSLMPLSFGTLKAAFYAMLLALPLAIGGAIFTAYFMAPKLRRQVKPAIELMEALPTVILGFLAGLWLAPFVERYLPGIFMLLILTPIVFVFVAFLIFKLPTEWRLKLAPEGWEPLILVPVLVLCVFISIGLSDPIQSWLFGGDVRVWLTSAGIDFDQRNALVVGIAMGFAVIPTIFSIAEDAVFAVPKSLTQGSLALGATPWQTLVKVVLPTASPGIFSATMIGFGRAVGETMIVLMATGNTPIMDMNIFEGFRTLSANIAVELPEAEVHSTHYRVLFLAALVLFMFTFVLNTTAEYVRQRLRDKYGSL